MAATWAGRRTLLHIARSSRRPPPGRPALSRPGHAGMPPSPRLAKVCCRALTFGFQARVQLRRPIKHRLLDHCLWQNAHPGSPPRPSSRRAERPLDRSPAAVLAARSRSRPVPSIHSTSRMLRAAGVPDWSRNCSRRRPSSRSGHGASSTSSALRIPVVRPVQADEVGDPAVERPDPGLQVGRIRQVVPLG